MVGSSKILTVSYGTFSCTLEGFDDSFETMKAIAEYFRDLAADDRYFGAEPPTPDADMLARIAEREIARRVEAHEHEGRIVLRAQDNAAAGRALAAALGVAPGGGTAAQPEAAAPDAPETPARAEETTPREDAPAPDLPPEPEGLEREEPEQAAPPPEARDTAEEAAPVPPLVAQAEDGATAPPAVETDDLSARLDLIRSVVGAADSYDEDEHAQDFIDAEAAPLAWDMADEDETDAGQAGEGSAAPDAGDRLFEDTLAALLADAAPVDAGEAGRAPEAAARTDAGDAADESAHRDEAVSGPALDDDAPDAEEDAAPRRAARVLKVSRAEVEAAREDGLIDPLDAAGEDTVNIFGDDDSPLSPEDEAELQRELASLDAELEAGDAPGQAGAPAVGASPPADTSEPAGKRTEVSRIFDETDSQMADPGSVRRRNTIQHLRAALAATRAEKAAGADLAKKIDSSPYRGDLDAAVRPRRAIPAPDAPRSTRPEEPRPAPLKLVAEQRIDTARPPVRPRRVATTPPGELVEAQDTGFAGFAEERGAEGLPDLLEAAAAYLADVEGRSQFSRPMLMGKLREIDEGGFSREDGLRSFGQLLREGKLQKLPGGRFAVTGETEFRAATRRQAG
jgi:hypothetical protein